MSGKAKREGDWRCDKCNNLNFAWRLQCNRCKTRKSVRDNAQGGIGVGTALLVGAGAAAVGFLTHGLLNLIQEPSPSSSSSPSAPPPPPPTPLSSGVRNNDLERKKQRDAFRAQKIPNEMKCVICFLNPCEVCMVPCGHTQLCEDCAEEVKTKCPMCQQPIESKQAIYL